MSITIAQELPVCTCWTPQPQPVTGDQGEETGIFVCWGCGRITPSPALKQILGLIRTLSERVTELEKAPPTMSDPDELLGFKEAAKLAGLSYDHLRKNRTSFGFAPNASRVRKADLLSALRERKGMAA